MAQTARLVSSRLNWEKIAHRYVAGSRYGGTERGKVSVSWRTRTFAPLRGVLRLSWSLEFLSHRRFSEFMPKAVAAAPTDAGEQARRNTLEELLKHLRDDRIRLIEVEARRVMAMTDAKPEAMLRRLGESQRFRCQGRSWCAAGRGGAESVGISRIGPVVRGRRAGDAGPGLPRGQTSSTRLGGWSRRSH